MDDQAMTEQRRDFLKKMGVLGIGFTSSSLLFQACAGEEQFTHPYKCWVWMHADKEAGNTVLQERFRTLKSMGVTGVLISGDDERNYTQAKYEGLEAHVWMWTLNRGEMMEQHPEWYSINRKGESCVDAPPYVDYYRWLCPSRPAVQDYISGVVDGYLQKDYIDGIHLDYVRYCDVILPSALWEKYDLVQTEELPAFDFCYCEVCREKFKAKEGVDPKELFNPPGNQQWLQYRYDTVTQLVNRLSAEVHAKNKVVSAAVFPTPSIAKKLVRQDWLQWNLDMIFPMVYQGFYEEDVPWIGTAVNEGVTALNGKFPLYAGLYLPDLPQPTDLENGVKFALENGAGGVSLFGEVSDEHWKRFKAAIKPTT